MIGIENSIPVVPMVVAAPAQPAAISSAAKPAADPAAVKPAFDIVLYTADDRERKNPLTHTGKFVVRSSPQEEYITSEQRSREKDKDEMALFSDLNGGIHRYKTMESPYHYRDMTGQDVFMWGTPEHSEAVRVARQAAEDIDALLKSKPKPQYVSVAAKLGAVLGGLGGGALGAVVGGVVGTLFAPGPGTAAGAAAGAAIAGSLAAAGATAGAGVGMVAGVGVAAASGGAVAGSTTVALLAGATAREVGAGVGATVGGAVGKTAFSALADLYNTEQLYKDQPLIRENIDVLDDTGVLRLENTMKKAVVKAFKGKDVARYEALDAWHVDTGKVLQEVFGDTVAKLAR